MARRLFLVDIHRSRFYRNDSAISHRVARIRDDVHQNLLQPVWLHGDEALVEMEIQLKPDIFACQNLHHPVRRLDDFIQADRIRRLRLSSAESHQLSDETCALLRRSSDFISRLAKRLVTRAKVQERIGGNCNDREQIVEVMSNAAGKTTDRLHLLGLAKLLLEEFALRNVFNNCFKPGKTTVARSHNTAAETNLNRTPVLRLPFGFE